MPVVLEKICFVAFAASVVNNFRVSTARLQRSLRATFLGLAVNVALTVAKFLAGILGHSQALIADAVESLADIFSSIIVWRGLVQGTLRRRFGARAAVVGTALLYAAVQLPVGAPLLIIAAFACGLVWGGLRHSQADATAPAAAHVAWDTVVLLIMPVGNG